MSKRDTRTWAERGRVETRKGGDRHKAGREQSRKRGPRSKAATHRFVGLDGESVKGRYTLLAAASDDGWDDWIERREGLSTRDCLTFLTSLPSANRYWGFAFGYDVNMMLVDLTMPQVNRLYETRQVYWREFRIAYTPGKRLQVTRYTFRSGKRVALSTTTVWDMFPWIQRSFAAWIADWKLAPPAEVERILAMKAKRSTFTDAEHDAIKRYCLSECRYLAAGARRLVTLIADAGIATSSYYSPATISKAMMKRQGVNDYRAEPPAELARAIDAAYIGGRSEVALTGPIEGPIYNYDINSAYPAAAVNLPCLAHGRWVHHVGRNGGVNKRRRVEPWSLVRVSWKPLPGEARPVWGPFPKRPHTGSLRWPRHGTAWVWGVEYLAGRRHAQVEVKDHWEFVPNCLHRPFAYLADTYAVRKERKAAGDPTEYVLKLALNATYGALAEHPHRTHGGGVEQPRYRCLAWAGWITAATRAKLLDVLTDDVVLLATDGILSRAPLDVPITEALGDWECKVYDEAWIAGSGIYFAKRDGEWVTTRTRGFESGQLTRLQFSRLWKRAGRTGTLNVKRSRFIGMGTALHRVHGFYPPQARLWRQFVTEVAVKSLDVEPRREWLTDDTHDGRSVAPSHKAHVATAKLDRERLAALHAEYDRLFALYSRIEAGWPEHRVHLFYAMPRTIRVQQRLLSLASMIHHQERGDGLFFDEDDPEV